MAWNWTCYAARHANAIRKSPASYTFTSALLAFVGGLNARNLRHGVGLERYGSLLSLGVALLMSYFLARTIRELRNGRGQV